MMYLTFSISFLRKGVAAWCFKSILRFRFYLRLDANQSVLSLARLRVLVCLLQLSEVLNEKFPDNDRNRREAISRQALLPLTFMTQLLATNVGRSSHNRASSAVVVLQYARIFLNADCDGAPQTQPPHQRRPDRDSRQVSCPGLFSGHTRRCCVKHCREGVMS